MHRSSLLYRGEKAEEQLARLGLTEELLQSAIGYGVARMRECSPFSPRTAPGYYLWSEATAALRENLVPHGWRDRFERGLELVVSPDGLTAICVCQGDAATGTSIDPKTKRERGSVSVSLVGNNRDQLELFIATAARNRRVRNGKRLTWWLLIYPGEREIRAELALPTEVDEKGALIGWEDRIVLSPIPSDPDPVSTGEKDDTEEVIVPVKPLS